MTALSVLLLAAQGSDVTSGAPLTLVVPLGLVLVALAVWALVFRHSHRGD